MKKKESQREKPSPTARAGSRSGRGGEPRPVVWRRVTSTVNNTKVVVTWYEEKTGRRVNQRTTAGKRGFVNTKRSSVYAAQEVRARAGKAYLEAWAGRGRASQPGVHVLRRGMGRGRVHALTELKKAGVEIVTVSDATKDPHNGCRRKKVRRI